MLPDVQKFTFIFQQGKNESKNLHVELESIWVNSHYLCLYQNKIKIKNKNLKDQRILI